MTLTRMKPSPGTSVTATGLMVGALLLFAGCTQSSNFNQGGTLPQQQATPLPAQPSQPVQQGELPPPPGTDPQVAVNQPQPIPDAPTAVVAPPQEPADSKPVTRQAMVGAWTVSTGGTNCQIFLALTKWSGGYRAASRGCSAAAISDVQAWDVKGKQVVLVDSGGATAATLFRSGDTRYDGSTKTGTAISFNR